MSNSKGIEGGKRRLPAPPPPPIISGSPRRSRSNDSVDNYESQYRRSSTFRPNYLVENYESPFRRSSSPYVVQGPPPLKIRKEYSNQHDQPENASLHEKMTQKQPIAVVPPTKPIVRCILNADEIKIPRRPEESKKPIFHQKEIRDSYNEQNYKKKMELTITVPGVPILPMSLYPAEISDEGQGDANEMVSYSNSIRTVVASSASHYLSKKIDLESDGGGTKKKYYAKRENQLEEIDDYYIKPGAIWEDQTIKKRKSHSGSRREQFAKYRGSSHSSDEFGNSDYYSKSESQTNAEGTEVINFKKMTLDWAADAPEGHPSQRIGFLIPFFGCCTAQELYWAKNWATKISLKRNKKAR